MAAAAAAAAIAVAALGYNTNKPEPGLYRVSSQPVAVTNTTIPVNALLAKKSLPVQAVGMNLTPFHQGGNQSRWEMRRYELDSRAVLQNMRPSAVVDTQPVCDADFFCPPGPCLFLEVDYQTYNNDENYAQTLIGAPSCGPVFGRSLQNGLGTAPPTRVATGDQRFYPGSVVSEQQDSRQRVSGLTKLKTPHPRYGAEPVPVWAPIDGLGDLTGEFDFQQVGDTDFPAADNVFILANSGVDGKPGVDSVTTSSPLQAADFKAFEARCLEAGVDAGKNTTLIRITVSSAATVGNPKALVYLICTLYLDTEADLGLVQPQLSTGQRVIDYRRAANFQAYRRGSLAGNLPIVLVTNGEDKANFLCNVPGSAEIVEWPKIQGLDCAKYGYMDDALLTCQCFSAQVNATLRLNVSRPPPGCCKWVENTYVPPGDNVRFDAATTAVDEMRDLSNVTERNQRLDDNATELETIVAADNGTLNNFVSLIATGDHVIPCCPWFTTLTDTDGALTSADGCEQPESPCHLPPTNRCTMTAAEVLDAFQGQTDLLSKCQRAGPGAGADGTLSPLVHPFAMNRFHTGDFVENTVLNLDADVGPFGSSLGGEYMPGQTFGPVEDDDNPAGVRRMIVVNPGPAMQEAGLSDAITIILAEEKNDTVFRLETDRLLVRTVTNAGGSVTDPCSTIGSPLVKAKVTVARGASAKSSAAVSLILHLEAGCEPDTFWCRPHATVLSAAAETTPPADWPADDVKMGAVKITRGSTTPEPLSPLTVGELNQLSEDCGRTESMYRKNTLGEHPWCGWGPNDSTPDRDATFWKQHAITTGVYYEAAYKEWTTGRPHNDGTADGEGNSQARSDRTSPSTFCRWHQAFSREDAIELPYFGSVKMPQAPIVADWAGGSPEDDFTLDGSGYGAGVAPTPVALPCVSRTSDKDANPCGPEGEEARRYRFEYVCTPKVVVAPPYAIENIFGACSRDLLDYLSGIETVLACPISTSYSWKSDNHRKGRLKECLGGGSKGIYEYRAKMWFLNDTDDGAAIGAILNTSWFYPGGLPSRIDGTPFEHDLQNSRYACRCNHGVDASAPKALEQTPALQVGHDGAVFYRQCCHSEYASVNDIPAGANPTNADGTPVAKYHRPQWRPHLDGYLNSKTFGGRDVSCAVGASSAAAAVPAPPSPPALVSDVTPWQPTSKANFEAGNVNPKFLRGGAANDQSPQMMPHSFIVSQAMPGQSARTVPPSGGQQFAIETIVLQECRSKQTEHFGPPVFQRQSSKSSAPPVPDDYTGRPYFAAINAPLPQPCNCRSATPVYACLEVDAAEARTSGYPNCDPADSFNGSMCVLCGWSWSDPLPLGVPLLGLHLGSTVGGIETIERDPLGNAATAVDDAGRFFLEPGAPLDKDLRELISNVGESAGGNDFAANAFSSGSSANGKVHTTQYPGSCLRAPYGRVNRAHLSSPHDFYNNAGTSTNAGISVLGDEALYLYCEMVDGKFVRCDDDGMSLEAREGFCNAQGKAATSITLGVAIGNRGAACSAEACLYFPGDPTWPTISDVLDEARGKTVVVAPVSWNVMAGLTSAPKTFDWNAPGAARYSMSSGQNMKPSGVAGVATADLQKIYGASWTSVADLLGVLRRVAAVVETAYGIYAADASPPRCGSGPGESQCCPEGQAPGPPRVGFVQDVPREFACYAASELRSSIPDRGSTVAHAGVTLVAIEPDIQVPAPATRLVCTVFEVLEPGFVVEGRLVVDNSGCEADAVHDQIPIVLEGASAVGTSISLHLVSSAPAAVTAVGYDRDESTLSRTKLDVTGLRLNLSLADDKKYTSQYAAVFSRVYGVSAEPVVSCMPADNDCSVLVQYAGAEDYRNLTWGGSEVKVVDVTEVLQTLAHQERQLHATNTARFEAVTLVYFVVLLPCLIAAGVLVARTANKAF